MSNKITDTKGDKWDNRIDTFSVAALWVLGTLSVVYFGGHLAFWLIIN